MSLLKTHDTRGKTMLHQNVLQSCLAVHQQCFGLVPYYARDLLNFDCFILCSSLPLTRSVH